MTVREAFLSKQWQEDIGTVEDIEFHVTLEDILPAKLLTIIQVLLLPDEDFQAMQEEQEAEESMEMHPFELGLDYVDDSAWSDMVMLSLIEVGLPEDTRSIRLLCRSSNGSRTGLLRSWMSTRKSKRVCYVNLVSAWRGL